MNKIRLIELLDQFYASLEIVKETDNKLTIEITKRPIKKALDVGMGFARIATKLIHKGLIVHGVEIDNYRIQYIRQKKQHPNLKVEKKDARYLDFNEEFDAAYSASFLQIRNLGKVLKGIFKSIKPGGWFFVTVDIPSKKRAKEDFNQKVNEFVSKLKSNEIGEFKKALKEDTDTFHFLCKTPDEWKQLIKSVGFKIEDFFEYYPKNAMVVAKKPSHVSQNRI